MRTSLSGWVAGAALHCFASLPGTASAHEFWIEPARADYAPGETVTAELKVGVALVGEPWPYLSSRFRGFTVADDGGPRAVEGAEGDLPALDFTAVEPGLHAVAHETVAFRATHDDWQAFVDYLAMEGLAPVAAEHRRRGLPRTGFAERYIRHARALVQVGAPEPGDADRPSGMVFEIVAEDTPFRPGLSSLPIRLTRDARPVPDHQITLYAGTAPAERTLLRTDSEGRISVPLRPGALHLLNAVVIDPVDAPPVAWESRWASLAFRLPEAPPEQARAGSRQPEGEL